MNEPGCPNCKSKITFGLALFRGKRLTKIKCPYCNAILARIKSELNICDE